MSGLILSTPNPLDISRSELESFAGWLRGLETAPSVSIAPTSARRGAYAVTLYEVFTVWIPTAITYASVIAVFVKWARKRFGKSPDRPKSLTIYDLDGNPLASVVIHDELGPVEHQPLSRIEARSPPDTTGSSE